MIDPTQPLQLSDGTAVEVVGFSEMVVEVVLVSDTERAEMFVHPVHCFSRATGAPILQTQANGETRTLQAK